MYKEEALKRLVEEDKERRIDGARIILRRIDELENKLAKYNDELDKIEAGKDFLIEIY